MTTETDRQQAILTLRDKGTRFLDYLSAVSRTFAVRTPQRVEKSAVCILSSQIPIIPGLISVGSDQSNQIRLSVKRPNRPEPVDIPQTLSQYIDRSDVRNTHSVPKLNAKYDELAARYDDVKHRHAPDVIRLGTMLRGLREAFASWTQRTWEPWCQRTRPYEQVSDLYQKLFDLYLRLDKESDYYELLFGHCILTWDGRKSVDYPLVLTSAHMTFKESTGSIQIETTAPSRMSVSPFEGTDLPGYALLARYQDSFNDHPSDMWNEAERESISQSIVKQLGAAAYTSDGLDLNPGEAPALQKGWCLLLRKRSDNKGVFYQGLSRKLQGTDSLPAAFDSMFSDYETVSIATEGRTDDGTDDRLLMPLPANEEQKRIIRQLSHSYGVTVQGPPGTGKSHTIVNLIAHLLAHGKRILVTAEKAQALAVLQNNLPDEIKDLVVSSIGESVADTESLRLSVQRMQDSLNELDVSDAQRRIDHLNGIIDESDARIESINEELAARLAEQTDEYDIQGRPQSAEQVARWVTGHTESNLIPDHIPAEAPMPLTSGEYGEYLDLLKRLSPEDIQESGHRLPDETSLPTGAELRARYDRLNEIQQTIAELNRKGLNLRSLGLDDELGLEETLKQTKAAYEKLASVDGDWERSLSEQLRGNERQCGWLRQQLDTMMRQVDKCLELSNELLGHAVVVPQGNPNEQEKLIDLWNERMRQGKGLPRFRYKELREFGDSVTVDGYRPNDEDGLRLVRAFVVYRRSLENLDTFAEQVFGGLPVPSLDVKHMMPSAVAGTLQRISALVTWWDDTYRSISQRLRRYFPLQDPARDIETLSHTVSVLEEGAAVVEERDLRQHLEGLGRQVDAHVGKHDSKLWGQLSLALKQQDCDVWQQALDETSRLVKVRDEAARLKELQSRLDAAAPQWVRSIQESRGDRTVAGDAGSFELIWHMAQASSWIHDISQSSDLTGLLDESRDVIRKRQEATVNVIDLAARLHLKQTQRPDDRKALNIWLDAIKKYGKGTGRNAENYLATARRELPRAMNAMPVWIMPLHRVMESFDPSISQLFDVIIVDESSQCDLLSVGVLALADKAVIVGDDKQTSPSSAFKSIDKIVALQNRYIPDIPGRSLLTFDESLYTMSNRVFQSQIMLREHFRCVPEIIDYSNRFYDRQIFPLRERTHPQIGSPLQSRFVPNAQVRKTSKETINDTEAQAIARQVKECCSDPHYDGMTFGVVTMMSGEGQQKSITDRLIDAIGAEEYAKRRLRVGNPPAFQGDERDVIFLSFVTNSAGGHSYAATKLSDAQWANVAASRAKNQLWAFYSMDPSALNPNDYRRGLIEYIRDYADHDEDEQTANPLTEIHTEFERDIVHQLLAHGYEGKVQTHHRVGRYSIDCVVTLGSGFRLAIECDGDERKTKEEFVQDIAKQRVLERLGWHFMRLSAPSYYLDPEHTMEPVLDRLKTMAERCAELSEQRSSSSDSGRIGAGEQSDGLSAIMEDGNDSDPQTIVMEDAPSSGIMGAIESPSGDFSADSDEENEGNDYLSLDYVQMLDETDIPGYDDHNVNDRWMRSTVMMFVSNEFPLSSPLLYARMIPLLGRKGVDPLKADDLLTRTIRDLMDMKMIRRFHDGFYGPTSEKLPFRIVQGRRVSDISALEVAAVICRLLNSPRGERCDFLSIHLDLIYGWKSDTVKTTDLIDRAFLLLRKAGFIDIDHGYAIPLDGSVRTSGRDAGSIIALDERAFRDEDHAGVTTNSADESHMRSDGVSHGGNGSSGERTITSYGKQYGLDYVDPLRHPEDFPLRGDYPNTEEWLSDVVMKLVYLEYPLCYAFLCKQVQSLLIGSGVDEEGMHSILRGCLERNGDRIRMKSDGFYYPADESRYPFRIVRYREIDFISVLEIAFVMRQVVRHHPMIEKSAIFDETFAVYGFRAFTGKIHQKFEEAYRILLRSSRIDGEGRIMLKTGERLTKPGDVSRR